VSLPAGLPAPVARWLADVPELDDDVDATGTGAAHQIVVGRSGAWLPLTWSLRLRPAKLFVWEASVRVLGIRKVRAGEEYVSSRGRLTAGRHVHEGDQIDRAEQALLWFWTLAVTPWAAARHPSVIWEAAGPSAARVLFPYQSEVLEALLAFDEDTGLLRRFETRRYELRAGFPRLWSAELDAYRDLASTRVPSRLAFCWDGEPSTRLTLEMLASRA